MRRLALVLVVLALAVAAAPAGAAQYDIPPGNPFAGVPGARAEVFHLGLRNPFRFSIDSTTGVLHVGDVGAGTREEVSRVSAGARGLNFGWPCREGTVDGPSSCNAPGATGPLLDYANGGSGAAVTGGLVVRASAGLPSYTGDYLFGDFYSVFGGAIQATEPGGGFAPTGAVVDGLSAFGEAGNGAIHVASLNDGGVYRLSETGGNLDTELVSTFSAPIGVLAPPGDPRLFVPELGGEIKVRVGGADETFLDLSGLVASGGERGLLGMAFSPDYESSGRFYVFYTDDEPGDAGDLRVDEFRRSASDPDRASLASRRPLLQIEHSQFPNHNGGQLHFGVDGHLYISTGDGGGSTDPVTTSQNRNSLLGKVLRIDPTPSTGGGLPPVGGGNGGSGAAGSVTGNVGAVSGDALPPSLRTRTRRSQRILKNGGVVFHARCGEPCVARGRARLRIGSRSYALKRVRKSLAANERGRLRSRLTRRAQRALRRALRGRRRARVKVVSRALDLAGNSTALRQVTVRARR